MVRLYDQSLQALTLRSEGMRWRTAIYSAILVAALLSFAQGAKASCAYYVVPAHPSSEMTAGRAAMKESHSPDAPCPCRGPECRANQPERSVPTVSHVNPAGESALLSGGWTESLDALHIATLFAPSYVSQAYVLLSDPPPRSGSLFN
jgi:hypothetical protein